MLTFESSGVTILLLLLLLKCSVELVALAEHSTPVLQRGFQNLSENCALVFQDGIDKLYRNVGKELALLAA